MTENDIDKNVSQNEKGPAEQPVGPQQGAPAAPHTEPAAAQQPAGSQQTPAQPYAQPQEPYAAQPYAPQPQYQPQPQQPVFIPAPLLKLTGGMKFAWLVIGALVGIPGIILAWVCNVDKVPQVKNDAVKFAAIGFAVWIVLGIVFCLALGGMLAAAIAGYGTGAGYYGYYGSTW